MFNLYINDTNKPDSKERVIKILDPINPKAIDKLSKKVKGWFKALETHTINGDVECLRVSQLITVASLEREHGVEGFDALSRQLLDCYPYFSVSLTSKGGALCEVDLTVRRGPFGQTEVIDAAIIDGHPSHAKLTSLIFDRPWAETNSDIFEVLETYIAKPLMVGVQGDNRNITAVITLGNRTAVVDVSDNGRIVGISPSFAHAETLSMVLDTKLVTIQLKYTE